MGKRARSARTLRDVLVCVHTLQVFADQGDAERDGSSAAEVRAALRQYDAILRRALAALEMLPAAFSEPQLCADIRDVLGDPPWTVEMLPDGTVVPDKPVPHPSDKTPVPADHEDTIRHVENGGG